MDREEFRQRSQEFERRRQELNMPVECLAMRSGLRVDRVSRILDDGEIFFVDDDEPNFVFEPDMNAIATALGLTRDGAPMPADEYCKEQARLKAEKLTSLVQGTSALEGQGVDAATYEEIVTSNTTAMLFSPHRLWTPL